MPDTRSRTPLFKRPFEKHEQFIVRADEPFNGGTPPPILRQSFVTPTEQFYVRTHAPVPSDIDAREFRLIVEGMVRTPLKLSLDELRKNFAPRTVMATLQCAGNRREPMLAIGEMPGEVPWGSEAFSNARWEGARLRDVLQSAAIDGDALHVEFIGLDQVQKHGETFGFGGSIPIEKAIGDEVLLAWGMNGEPLQPVHGYPLRVVVPGYIAARSVKWLSRIIVQKHPSQNYYQQHAYKIFPPQVRTDTADWETGLMLGDFPVNSVITSPTNGQAISAGEVTIEGIAVAGGGRRVERVDVSTDDGQKWITAERSSNDADDRWTWRFWSATTTLSPGRHRIVCRAWDSAANTQPEDTRAIWNFKGYVNNAWDRVEVDAKA